MSILRLIRQRQSTRVRFDPKKTVSNKHLEQIVEAARWAPTAHNMQNFEIVAVDDPRLLGAIGRIRSKISEDFLRENYQQLSFSKQELLRKKLAYSVPFFLPRGETLLDCARLLGRAVDQSAKQSRAARSSSS